ncbi:uncharacterized protein LOC143514949 [Brachyhypopomus gauderio]|uniref:uncharacterized protein LOC143514949 n=1 Tax=Brachyhypopomus gauderio TaxID=698409 RepID=UPI0040411E7E
MAKRKRDAAPGVRWTSVLEDKFVELWQQYPCLFDIASREYHDRVRKERSWRDIAEAIQLPVGEVQTKAASLRTQYGKLLRPQASGSGDKELTARQKWIMRSLVFLQPFVTHRVSQTTLNVDMHSVSTDITEEVSEYRETEDDVSESSTFTLSTSPTDQTLSSSILSSELNSPGSASFHSSLAGANKPDRAHKSKQKSKDRGSDDIECEKVAILKSMSQTLLSTSQDVDETFGKQVVSEIKQIKDPVTKMRLRRNILLMLYDAQEAEQRASPHPVPQSTTQRVHSYQTPWQGLKVMSSYYPNSPSHIPVPAPVNYLAAPQEPYDEDRQTLQSL